MLTQNGFKIIHLVLDCTNEHINYLNQQYTRINVPITEKDLTKHMNEKLNIVIINDFDVFKKYSNLDAIKSKNNISLILNRKFEVFMPSLNKYYTIIDDKELLTFSGILGSLRPMNEFVEPFIPKVNFFVKYYLI